MNDKLIPLDKALNFQIFKLSLMLSRELTKALKAFDLTPERWQILSALWNRADEMNQSELAALTLKDKPSISRLVEVMVKSGWVLRRASPEDSRAYLLRPSAKANAHREKILQALNLHFQPIFKELGKASHDEMFPLVVRYIQAIDKCSGGASD